MFLTILVLLLIHKMYYFARLLFIPIHCFQEKSKQNYLKVRTKESIFECCITFEVKSELLLV